MSWGIAILIVIMMALIALVARATASKTKKRFGLKEAEAAKQYVGDDPNAARAVKGVVIGVLAYEDAVAEDVRALSAEMSRENDASAKSIEANRDEIERLIAENEGLHGGIAANEAEVAGAEQVAALFRS